MTNLLKVIFVNIALFAIVGCSSNESGSSQNSDTSNIIGVTDFGEPKISYCLPRYLSDAETRTIYEVFTGEEMPYGHLILRSNPNKRAGMYFFVMFGYTPDDIALGCRFILEVDSNQTAGVRKFVFDVPKTYSVLRELKLALTGDDWKKKERVNAWRLTLISPSGKILTQSQSWLWDINKGDSRLNKQSATTTKSESEKTEK